jgi:hypothetical protein
MNSDVSGTKRHENKTLSTTATVYPAENPRKKMTGVSIWQGSSQLPICQTPSSPLKTAKMQSQYLQLAILPTNQACRCLLQDVLLFKRLASSRAFPYPRFPLKNRSVPVTSTGHPPEALAQQLRTNTKQSEKV